MMQYEVIAKLTPDVNTNSALQDLVQNINENLSMFACSSQIVLAPDLTFRLALMSSSVQLSEEQLKSIRLKFDAVLDADTDGLQVIAVQAVPKPTRTRTRDKTKQPTSR